MTCRIIDSLSEISDAYDAILCDLWGCYHNGVDLYPAAVAACRAFRERGGLVVLLTNAPRPAASVERMIVGRMGAPRDSWDAIVSSGGACQSALAERTFGERVHYVGPARDLHMLREEADLILLTGLRDDMTETPADYTREIARWVGRGLPMLCANPDIMVDRGDLRLWCAGAIARDFEATGGRVIWYGKPHAPVYRRCRAVLRELAGREVADARILAIGDGIATDVAGGIAAGFDTVFVTGGLSGDAFGADVERPEQALLDAFLADKGLAPGYAIGRLR